MGRVIVGVCGKRVDDEGDGCVRGAWRFVGVSGVHSREATVE